MTTPDFRTLCAELLQAWQFGDDIAGPMNRACTALKAEPEGESPRPDGDWFAVALVAQDMRSRGLAEQVAGEELLKLANSNRSQPGRPATQPSPETPAEALAARPLLERVAAMADRIGIHTVGEITAISDRAAAWLRDNPPGQPVAIEPRGCPTPGACSCVGPTPPAPEPGEVGELVALLKIAGRWATSTGVHLDRFAALFDQQAAELAALRQQPHPTFQDAIRLAEGCHYYSGGHSGAEGEAWHGAIDLVVDVLKRAAVGPWDSQLTAVYGVGAEAQAGDVGVTERRPEGDWVNDLQHAIESKEDDFLGGVCVALALVTAHGEATIWREIVRSVGTDSLLNYAANVNPDDWNLAGFGEYAQSELGKGKPDPAP